MMTKLGLGIATVLAFLSAGCSDDDVPPPGGGAPGSGGQAGAGGSGGAPSCDGTVSTDEKFFRALQALRDALAKQHVPGGAIAVVKDGKLVNLGVAGSKRATACDPITPDTLFRMGAATALITSLAALDAVEDRKLSLRASIKLAIPELDVIHGDVQHLTLHHLLTLGGMYSAESIEGPPWSNSSDCMSDLAGAFADATKPVLQATPGSMQNRLCNNLELAGLALQNVDAKPFVEAVAARVLEPLGMGGAFDTASIEATDHSIGHLDGNEDGLHAECRNRDPSENYHGSIRDMARLAEYLTGGVGQILEPDMLDAMLSEQGPNFASYAFETYGLDGYHAEPIGDDVVWASGFDWGFTEDFTIYKKRRLAVITLMNSQNCDPAAVGSEMARIYDPGLEDEEFPGAAYRPAQASLDALLGEYQDDLGYKTIKQRTLTLSRDSTSGQLVGTLTSDDTSEQASFTGMWGADNFALERPDKAPVLARFWRDEAGNAYAVSLLGNFGPPFFRVSQDMSQAPRARMPAPN